MCTANSRSEVIQRSWTALRNCNETLTASKGALAQESNHVPGHEVPKCIKPYIVQGLYVLFDVQEPAAQSPSLWPQPGQASSPPTSLCSSCPQLKAAGPALPVYMFPNSRRKREYQTDLGSFEVAGGCYQVQGVCCAFEACLSFPAPLTIPVSILTPKELGPSKFPKPSQSPWSSPGSVLKHSSVCFSDMEVSLFFWNQWLDWNKLLSARKKIRDLICFLRRKFCPLAENFLL